MRPMLERVSFWAQKFYHVGQRGKHLVPPAHFAKGKRTIDEIKPEGCCCCSSVTVVRRMMTWLSNTEEPYCDARIFSSARPSVAHLSTVHACTCNSKRRSK